MMVTLIRHSITVGNMAMVYQGCLDHPLCPEGIELARSIQPDHEVRKVYTSHLMRTVQTAEILYPLAVIVPHAGLAEMNFGRFEGRSWKDMAGDPEYEAWVASNCEAACPGGEGKAGYPRRCRKTFEEILASETRDGAERLNLVVHAGTIRAVLSELALPERGYFDWKAQNCGGYLLEYDSLNVERPLRLLRPIVPPGFAEDT